MLRCEAWSRSGSLGAYGDPTRQRAADNIPGILSTGGDVEGIGAPAHLSLRFRDGRMGGERGNDG